MNDIPILNFVKDKEQTNNETSDMFTSMFLGNQIVAR